VFQTGFHDLAPEALRDFYSLGHATSFRNQAGDVGAGCQITAVFESLDTKPDSNLIYFGDVLLSLTTTLAFCCHEFSRTLHFTIVAERSTHIAVESVSRAIHVTMRVICIPAEWNDGSETVWAEPRTML
jgi:hypothetical protein